MDTKSLSSRQVQLAQKLSRYHFQIDYWQGKANGAIDTLSQYPQRSAKEEETFWAKNIKILRQLQSSLVQVLGLNVSGLSVLGLIDIPSPLHQVFICRKTVLPQLRQFWDTIRSELADKSPYSMHIGGMRMRLP